MPIWCRNFLGREDEYIRGSTQQLVEFMHENEGNDDFHGVEIIDSPTSCVYFDIDVKTYEDRKGLSPKEIIDDVLEVIEKHGSLDEVDRSICTSHSPDPKGKLSWHIVYDVWGKRKDMQIFVTRIAQFLKLPNILDWRVYKSVQRWRLVNATKPTEGVNNPDPEQRRKTLVNGTMEGTIIGRGDKLLMEWDWEIPAGCPKTIDRTALTSPRLKWFSYILKESAFKEILTKKSGDYEAWLKIGGSLYIEAKDTHCLDAGLELFIDFSKLVPGKFNDEEVRVFYKKSFEDATNQFAWMKRLITKANPLIALKYQIVYEKGEDLERPSLFGDDDLKRAPLGDDYMNPGAVEDIRPVNSYEYRLKRHLQRPKIRAFWASRITHFGDLQKLYQLSLYGPNDNQNREIKEVKKLQGKAADFFGRDTSPLYEWTKSNFMECVAKAFDFPYEEAVHEDWTAREYTEKDLAGFWDEYNEHLRSGNVFVQDIEASIESRFIYRLKPYQEVNWLMRFFDLHALAASPDWATQVPYREIFRKIHLGPETMGKETIVISHFLPLFETERLYGFLARASSYNNAARIIYHFYPYWMRSGDAVLVFDDMTGVWSQDEHTISRILTRFINLVYTKNTNYCDSASSRKSMIQEIQCIEAVNMDLNRMSDMARSGEGKLLFPNGYYDGLEGVFHERYRIQNLDIDVFFNSHILMHASVPDPWEPCAEHEEIKALLYATFFQKMFKPEIAEYILENYAATLFGMRKKEWMIFLGEPGSGKSTWLDFLKACVGPLAGTITLDKLRFNPKDSRDSTKYSFVWDNWMKRFLFASEGATTTVDSELVKTIVSGGLDEMVARTQFKSDRTFPILFRVFVYVNQMFELSSKEAAMVVRTTILNYPFVFKKTVESTLDDLAEDKSVETWRFSSLYRQCMVELMTDAFARFRERGLNYLEKPAALSSENPFSIGEIGNSTEAVEQLMHHVVIHGRDGTKNRSDCITAQRLHEIINSFQPGSSAHVIRKLGNFLADVPHPYITRIQQKRRGVNIACWSGISERDIIMETEGGDGDYLTDPGKWKLYMKENGGVLSEKFIDDLRGAMRILKRKRKREEIDEESNNTLSRFHLD